MRLRYTHLGNGDTHEHCPEGNAADSNGNAQSQSSAVGRMVLVEV